METDRSLLEAARRMDQRALVAIFDRYAAELYSYVMRLYYDPYKADNLVGRVFSKFLEQLSDGEDAEANLRSHLYKLTYSLMADATQFTQLEASLEFAVPEPVKDQKYHASAENSEDEMLLEKVTLAIKKHMTNDQRHVIVLRFMEGFSLHETAEIVGKRVHNVRAIQNRAITNVRNALNREAMA